MGGEPPHDNLDVEAFVHDHKRSTLRKLTKLNMYEVWEDDIDDIHIVAFADEHDPEGESKFLSVATWWRKLNYFFKVMNSRKS